MTEGVVAVYFVPEASYWPGGCLHLEHGVNYLGDGTAKRAIAAGVVRLANNDEIKAYEKEQAEKLSRQLFTVQPVRQRARGE